MSISNQELDRRWNQWKIQKESGNPNFGDFFIKSANLNAEDHQDIVDAPDPVTAYQLICSKLVHDGFTSSGS